MTFNSTAKESRRNCDRRRPEYPAPKRSKVTSTSSSVTSSLQHNPCVPSSKMEDMISGIQVMKVQESTTYRTMHYLNQTVVTEEDRELLCQWGFNVSDACKVNHSIAVIAIGYFDRFLSKRGLRVVEVCLEDQREFQLAFLVSSFSPAVVLLPLLCTLSYLMCCILSRISLDMPCHRIEGT